MKYPAIGKTASRVVSVPSLSGGINLSDPLNLVDDNQLTDIENLWYKNGTLRTRPALKAGKQFDEGGEFLGYIDIYSANLSQFIGGEKYTLLIKKIKSSAIDKDGNIEVVAVGENGLIFSANSYFEHMPESEVFFTGQKIKSNGIGVFMIANYTVNTGVSKKVSELFEVTYNGSYQLQPLESNEYYSPSVMINGKGDMYTTLPVSTTSEYSPSVLFEGESVFFKAWHSYCFTTDGVSNYFTLPTSLLMHEVKIELTDMGSGFVHKSNVVRLIENDGEYSASIGDSGHTFTIHPMDGGIVYISGPLPDALNSLTNNLVIKIRRIYDFSGADSQQISAVAQFPDSPLHGMKFATWFGGSADGISGGTRLFLSGSDEKKNLLVWSDVNNPTYFPENNYAYIGEASQKITALAKQSDMLVIFKENELFYTTYTQGNSYTAEEIVSGAVTDVTAQGAIFPMAQIHSEIGCDIPKSIQLCGDRLVWACKDRHVYMLRSANQYSTCNVSPISEMCDRALSKVTNEEINTAKSCIYDGHYLLSFGNKIFVLNYDYYYFKNLPSYSDSKKSQRKLVWYLWEVPSEAETVVFSEFVSSNNNCSIISAHKYFPATASPEHVEYRLFEFSDDLDHDAYMKQNGVINSGDYISLDMCYKPITSMLQTKLFDFGMMERFKKIEQLYIGFGECAGKSNIEYVTDCGRIDRGGFELSGEADDFSAEYIKIKRFLPCINRALRFGIRLQCEGRIAVDGILIKYKPIGVTR
jgi:hypothetical protein